MFIDARSLPRDTQIDADVCVIGAGPAGVTIALELAAAGTDVCLLEAGGFRYSARVQSLYEGDTEGDEYPALDETRLSMVGGSGMLWAGWCRPLDPIDFEIRPWLPHSGWPFPVTELAPFLARAHEYCGLGPPDYDVAAWEQRSGRRRLAVAGHDVATCLFHVSTVRFGTRYRTALARATHLRAIIHAPLLRFAVAPDNQRVDRALATTLTGTRFAVRARRFVLAAGGIENARLLLLSGDCPERSLGNAYGLVGRYFGDHGFIDSGCFVPRDPALALDFYFPQPAGDATATVRGAFTLTEAALRRERLLNCAMFFHPRHVAHPAYESREVRSLLEAWDGLRGRAVPRGIAKRLITAARRPDRIALAAARRFMAARGPAPWWRMRAMFECQPNESNRIELADERDELGRPRARVRWRTSDFDLMSVRRAHELLNEAFGQAGLGHITTIADDDVAALRPHVQGGKHPMGATRMHDDPVHGVVDRHGRVHGLANLYVAGSSVFPTGGYANSTLTIVTLALRLARHLRDS